MKYKRPAARDLIKKNSRAPILVLKEKSCFLLKWHSFLDQPWIVYPKKTLIIQPGPVSKQVTVVYLTELKQQNILLTIGQFLGTVTKKTSCPLLDLSMFYPSVPIVMQG